MGPNRPRGLGGASSPASGRASDGWIKMRYPKIAAGGGMIGLGKGIGIVPSAVPAGAAARGKRAGGPRRPQRWAGLENGRTLALACKDAGKSPFDDGQANKLS